MEGAEDVERTEGRAQEELPRTRERVALGLEAATRGIANQGVELRKDREESVDVLGRASVNDVEVARGGGSPMEDGGGALRREPG